MLSQLRPMHSGVVRGSRVAAQCVARRPLLGAAGYAAVTSLLLQPASASSEAGFVTAPNGLQWRDDLVGEGPEPVRGANIRCHYTGRLKSNGQKFDSSYDRRAPLSFTVGVGQVIRGWDVGILGSAEEGIPAMKEGGKRTLVGSLGGSSSRGQRIIPPELGYGSRGAGGVIPPNATLEFDVELVPRK
ncbi:hypothetical protein QJQ45_007533 [Haematococcus lacustris]|nr:hypothetical protein QJQ45_007533 [Haematococcus lacustris]